MIVLLEIVSSSEFVTFLIMWFR